MPQFHKPTVEKAFVLGGPELSASTIKKFTQSREVTRLSWLEGYYEKWNPSFAFGSFYHAFWNRYHQTQKLDGTIQHVVQTEMPERKGLDKTTWDKTCLAFDKAELMFRHQKENNFDNWPDLLCSEKKVMRYYPIDIPARDNDPTKVVRIWLPIKGYLDGIIKVPSRMSDREWYYLFEIKTKVSVNKDGYRKEIRYSDIQANIYRWLAKPIVGRMLHGAWYGLVVNPSRNKDLGRLQAAVEKNPEKYYDHFQTTFKYPFLGWNQRFLSGIIRQFAMWYLGFCPGWQSGDMTRLGPERNPLHYIAEGDLIGPYGPTAYRNLILHGRDKGLVTVNRPEPTIVEVDPCHTFVSHPPHKRGESTTSACSAIKE